MKGKFRMKIEANRGHQRGIAISWIFSKSQHKMEQKEFLFDPTELDQVLIKNDRIVNGFEATGNLWGDDEEEDDLIEDTETDPESKEVLTAAEEGQLDLLKQLLSRRPDLVNTHDIDGYTPLHRACYNNHLDTIKYLMDMGANVRAKSNDGWEPLHSSAQWSQTEAAHLLLQAGADINCKSNTGLVPCPFGRPA